MIFQDMIDAFLGSFNYLNAKNKRKGFLLFSNKDLTHDLEAYAGQLQQQLRVLATKKNNPTDNQNFEEFKAIITDSIDKAKQARIKHASVQKKITHLPAEKSRDNPMIEETFKNPYLPAKFEQELVKGLKAIKLKLEKDTQQPHEAFHDQLKEFCHTSIQKISDYRPTRHVITRKSFT